MALLEMGGKTFTIGAGDTVVGRDPRSTIAVEGEGVLPRHAILQALPDGQVVIRKAVPQAEVTINGVRLGGEPTPLLHGDKVEVGGHELTFVDERRSGSTQYLQAMKPSDAPVPAVPQGVGATGREGQVTAGTGGRVVCLTDGREYLIAGSSLVFGRDATSDVVVPGRDVSRRHAEIIPTPRGYLLVDASTNGTFVNEQRLEGQRLLARADIVRIGDEQFRFYADSAPAGAAATPPPPAPGATERLKDTVHAAPGSPAPPASTRAPLASLLVRAGALKGQRIYVRTPVVNVGRADYNDIVLPDPSVSTAHAKLQHREGVWVLVDLDSTNGTFVDGERVKGEAAVPPGATVRFGDVGLDFAPTDDSPAIAKGGGTQLMQGFDASGQKPAPPPAANAARSTSPPAPAPADKPTSPSPSRAPQAVPAAPARPKHLAQASVAPAPQAKKGKGCGSGAAAVLVVAAALVYWVIV